MQMRLKKIGISYSEANFQNYWDWFSAEDLGDHFELVELSFLKQNSEDIQQCDGFILTGGIDVVPAIYGGKDRYPYMPDTFLPERDEFEKQIYHYSKKQRLPLLGICRGMQYVNILEGGKVFEDNGEVSHRIHKKEKEDKVHPVRVLKGSLLYEVSRQEKGEVNSAHHQAVDPDHLGTGLMISALSATDDRLIEALEYKDKTNKAFMLCVQWHPERMQHKEQNPFSQQLKEHFLQAVKNNGIPAGN